MVIQEEVVTYVKLIAISLLNGDLIKKAMKHDLILCNTLIGMLILK